MCLHGLPPNCPPLLSIETVSITVFSLLPDPGSFLWPRHPVRCRKTACEKAECGLQSTLPMWVKLACIKSLMSTAIPHLLASGHCAAGLPPRCAWPGSQVPGVLVQGVKAASRRGLLQRRPGRRTPAAAASRSLRLLSNHGSLATRSFCPCDQS